MNDSASATPYLHRHLRGDQFLHLRRPPALRLQAEQGTLWVTVDGEPDDITIDAGHSRVFDVHAAITVGTFGGDAVFTATPLDSGRGRWHRWWQARSSRLGPPAHEVPR